MTTYTDLATDPLLRFREEFSTLSTTTYLISNSLGPIPRGAEAALADYAGTWRRLGVRAWAEEWWDLPRRVGDLIGSIVHAPSGTVSMHANVTLAQAVVISALEWKPPRNRVVFTALNFPSLQYLYDRFARSLGAEIDVVESRDGIGVDTESLLARIDERTRLVPISHVLFKSAFIQDVEAICAKARSVGAHVLLDAYQSVGTLPVDVERLGCAFLAGGVLKWLCGGPGGAFLYVRPDLLARLEPRLTGWMAHPEPFAFEGPPMRYADGPYRFMSGTPNIPALYAAQAGPQLLLDAGMEAVREKSIRQTTRLIESAREEGWRVHASDDPQRRGGTVALDVPHAAAVKMELIRRQVLVDYRLGAGIRVAPHFFTRDEECDQAIDEIKDILRTGAWQSHQGARPAVT